MHEDPGRGEGNRRSGRGSHREGVIHLFLRAVLIVGLAPSALAQSTNVWTNTVGGAWQDMANWLGGAPDSASPHTYITNDTTKTVTIDGATPGTNLTITNLTIGAPPTFLNTLSIADAASPLLILSSLTVTNGGAIFLTNSTVRVDGLIGGGFNNDGGVAVGADGVLNVTNVISNVGRVGSGSLAIDGGALWAAGMAVGNQAGSQGTLSMSGGSMTLSSTLTVGDFAGANGAVWMTGGSLIVTNTSLYVGYSGTGQMTISNGTASGRVATVGANAGAVGTLTVAGGTLSLPDFAGVFFPLAIGDGVAATGTVRLAGGAIIATNGTTRVGNSGAGQMLVTGGSALLFNVTVGTAFGSAGTLTVDGGDVRVTGATGNLVIGDASGADGTVVVGGGSLTVTNNIQSVEVGKSGLGRLSVTNGLMLVRDLAAGIASGGAGTITVSGGYLGNAGSLSLGSVSGSTGALWITGGQYSMTNSGGMYVTIIGDSGSGEMVVSNAGVAVLNDVRVAEFGAGTLSMAGGAVEVLGEMRIGDSFSATGTVWVTGGQLTATNAAVLSVGYGGWGHLATSNGTVLAQGVVLGNSGPGGMVTMTGGTNLFTGALTISGGSSTLSMAGGRLIATNASTTIASGGLGQMSISGGTAQLMGVTVASSSPSSGTLTVSGGSLTIDTVLGAGGAPGVTGNVVVTSGSLAAQGMRLGSVFASTGILNLSGDGVVGVSSNLVLGPEAGFGPFPSATGIVAMAGGQLLVSNAVSSAALEVRRGTLTFNGGTITVDNLILTNGAGSRLIFNGGLLRSRATAVTNGVPFTVGNGVGAATFSLLGGSHSFSNGVTLSTTGSLTGTGTVSGLLTSAGTVAPGFSAGQLTLQGNLTQTVSSVLSFEIGGLGQGTGYDFIDLTGSAWLTGRLDVALINSFLPVAANAFTVMTASASIAGDFTNLTSSRVTLLGGSGSFLVTIADGASDHLILSDFSAGAMAVPEPSLLLLCVIGVLALRRAPRR